MKTIIPGLFFIMFCQFDDAQEQEHAVVFNAALTSDLASNMDGGIEQGAVYLGNVDLTMTLNTKKMKLWNGGTFFVYILNNHGQSLSALVGDFQKVNNIEADPNTRLYQIWYRQDLGSVSITIGQHDLNSVFAVSDLGDMFIDSSFGMQPDISGNVVSSIFPVATLGGIIAWNISPKLTLINGVYDGDPGSQSDNPYSLDWTFNKKEGAMTIHELQYNHLKDSKVTGTYKLGFWHHTANITLKTKAYKNTQGTYFMADQLLFREQKDSEQGLGAFVQLGLAPKKVNPVKSYLGLGFVYTGLISNRDSDQMGVALGHVTFSNAYRQDNIAMLLENETVLEVTYNVILNAHFSVQPDFQYVFNPSGSVSNNNALAGLIRLIFEL